MTEQQALEVRAFNRFYTRVIGLVNDHILDSAYSLPEARILFELDSQPGLTATEITRMLDIDKGYLSRILRRFSRERLVNRTTSADRRVATLRLTARGKKEFAVLDREAGSRVKMTFRNLTEKDIGELTGHMKAIIGIISQNKIIP